MIFSIDWIGKKPVDYHFREIDVMCQMEMNPWMCHECTMNMLWTCSKVHMDVIKIFGFLFVWKRFAGDYSIGRFFSISIHFSFRCCRFFMRWISLLFRFWASACILGNHAMIAFRSELRTRCSLGRPQFFTFQTVFYVDYSLNEVSFGAIKSGRWRAHGQHMSHLSPKMYEFYCGLKSPCVIFNFGIITIILCLNINCCGFGVGLEL